MLAVPARSAGCKEIVLCTPPGRDGKVHPAVLFAAKVAGVNRIFKAGGIPVSYTHLDVYKRQLYECSIQYPFLPDAGGVCGFLLRSVRDNVALQVELSLIHI